MTLIIHDALLPEGWTALSGGPKFLNTRIEGKNGQLDITRHWDTALWEMTVSYLRSEYESVTEHRIDDLVNFFLNRAGAYGFLVKDPFDYRHNDRAATGHVEEIDGVYRLTKRYPDVAGGAYYTRLITRPIEDTIALAGGASGGTLDPETGIVTGIAAPGTWTGQFLIPCVFLDDSLLFDHEVDGTVRAASVKLREVRL